MNNKQLIGEAKALLEKANITDVADVYTLYEHVFGISRGMLYAHIEDEVSDSSKIDEYMSLVKKRAAHIPLQHLTGHQEFYNLDFNVSEKVLVPRFDTEILVERALEILKGMENPRVLDMCTGSGCVAICLDINTDHKAKVDASDISKEALDVAISNNLKNNAKVNFFISDLFDKVSQKYDMIVSNPPYIKTEVIDTLDDEVKLHDPKLALDGGKSGLEFYINIIKNAGSFLNKGGHILFEVGHDQSDSVSKLLEDYGFKEIKMSKDLSGITRCVEAVFL